MQKFTSCYIAALGCGGPGSAALQCGYVEGCKIFIIDGFVKSPVLVTPAQAGVQNMLETQDSGLRRNDGCAQF